MSKFMKIHPVGAELFYAVMRTDITNLIVAFLDVTNAAKTQELYQLVHNESRNVTRTTVSRTSTRIMPTAPRTYTFNTNDVSGLGCMTVPR
jgi:flagellar biosynthesis regulator FlbT